MGTPIMIQRKTLKLYSPHEMQRKIHECQSRFRVAAWGRQSGKSTFAVNELLKQAWQTPKTKYWMLSPTNDQAILQYRRCVGMLMPCKDVMLKKNQTEKRIKLLNFSEIRFMSGEVLDNLRGEALHGAVIDEVRDQHPDLWSMVLRPMLTTTRGFATFISTPNGFDKFYDFYLRSNTDKEWSSFSSPSTCNPLFTQEEYEAAKSDMSEDQFAQEIMAEFRDIGSGSSFTSFGQHNIRPISPFSNSESYSEFLPILVGMDFNLSPTCWVLGQYRNRDIYYREEIRQLRPRLSMGATQSAAEELADRVKDHKLGVVLIGDASGRAGQRAATAGQSDYDVIKGVLRQRGIPYTDKTPLSNPTIKDRVNCANAAFKSADGSVHTWFHPTGCKDTIKDIQRSSFKMGVTNLAFDDRDKQQGHARDAATYPICVLAPIKAVGGGAKMSIISRTI